MTRPRGSPLPPRATSRLRDPVEMPATSLLTASPSFMIDPWPNSFSMAARVFCSSFSVAAMGGPFARSRGCSGWAYINRNGARMRGRWRRSFGPAREVTAAGPSGILTPEEDSMSAVLTAPPATKLTPDDLLRLPDGGKGYELVDGELKELNVSFLSSFVAGQTYFALRTHVGTSRLGWVSPEGTSFRCFPDDENRVRRADTAFHRLGRLTADQARAEGHCTVVPDLVVEVVSPRDLAYEVDEKRIEWQEAGAQLV